MAGGASARSRDLREQTGELPLPDNLDGHGGSSQPRWAVRGRWSRRAISPTYVPRSSGRDHAITLADLDLTVEHDDELVTGGAFAHEDGSGRLLSGVASCETSFSLS